MRLAENENTTKILGRIVVTQTKDFADYLPKSLTLNLVPLGTNVF
ncbi:MAG: hypothetical protein RLZZ46_1744 [Bacteroidota bacterium]|jgi:hypothetical protein